VSHLVKAIQKLRPNSQFTFNNQDYSTINWIVLDGDAPTQAEIDQAIQQVEADELAEAEAKAQAKAAAEAKLSALGLTTDDLRALGL
jgi:Tfp pilus assembly PilM family ATPase